LQFFSVLVSGWYRVAPSPSPLFVRADFDNTTTTLHATLNASKVLPRPVLSSVHGTAVAILSADRQKMAFYVDVQSGATDGVVSVGLHAVSGQGDFSGAQLLSLRLRHWTSFYTTAKVLGSDQFDLKSNNVALAGLALAEGRAYVLATTIAQPVGAAWGFVEGTCPGPLPRPSYYVPPLGIGSVQLYTSMTLAWVYEPLISAVLFTVRVHAPISAWFGIGFKNKPGREDKAMIDTDMIIGRYDTTGNIAEISDRYSTGFNTPKLDTALGGIDNVRNASVAFISGWVEFRFTREVRTGDKYDEVFEDLTTTLLWTADVTTSEVKRMPNPRGRVGINLITGTVNDWDRDWHRHMLLGVHGLFNFFAMGVCGPLAWLSARHARHKPWVWKLHSCLAVASVLLLWTAFALGMVADSEQFVSLHSQLGLTVVLGVTLQMFGGMVGHGRLGVDIRYGGFDLYVPPELHRPLRLCHQIFGKLILGLAVPTMWFGIVKYKPPFSVALIFWLWIGFFCALLIGLEINRFVSIRKGTYPPPAVAPVKRDPVHSHDYGPKLKLPAEHTSHKGWSSVEEAPKEVVPPEVQELKDLQLECFRESSATQKHYAGFSRVVAASNDKTTQLEMEVLDAAQC